RSYGDWSSDVCSSDLDLRQMRAPERVRRARDLDDDHLHQVGLMPVRVDDERRDQVELVARGDVLGAIDLGDRVEHDLPALGEERSEERRVGKGGRAWV